MLPGVGLPEIVVVGVVALLVIGPRDLPKMARMLAGYLRQARGLAREFQKSFDDMGRALELDELRKEVEALKRGEPLSDVTNEIKALERDIARLEGPRRPTIAPPPTAAPRAATAPAAAAPPALAAVKSDPPAPARPEETPAPDRKIGGA